MQHSTAIVSLLATAFYFFLAARVAVVHGKLGINSRQRPAIPISSESSAPT
jgi:hypothetical protein